MNPMMRKTAFKDLQIYLPIKTDKMKTKRNLIHLCLLGTMALVMGNSQLSTAQAQGTTAFTYQGQLNSGAGNANGTYDLRFAVYDANLAGNSIAGPITNSAVAVSNGLFTVTLDFGAGVFTGTNYWVEIGVRTNGGAGFATLVPRQPLTPAPYALYAPQSGSASSLSAQSPQITSLCPPGAVIAFAGASAPMGWLPCDGSSVPTATYPALFAAIGYTYGGSGSQFNLPDARSRAVIGTGQGSGTDDVGRTLSFRTLGQRMGEEIHTLTTSEMPNHSHTNSDGTGHSHGIQGGNLLSASGSSYGVIGSGNPTRSSTEHVSITIGSTGGNVSGVTVPHNVMQPSIVLNYIIKY
jgi:microcystin-dependent protein